MKFFLWLNVMLFILCSSCGREIQKNPPTQFEYQKMIGYSHQGCFAIKDDKLETGQSVTVLSMDEETLVFTTTIQKKLENSDNCVMLLEGRRDVNQNDSLYFYQLDLQGKEELSPSFTIVGKFTAKQEADFVTTDIDGNGANEYFTSCNGIEGINFSVWSGVPRKSKELWSQYYYLGYDMEPDCPE